MSAQNQQFQGQFKWPICGHERNQEFLQASIQRDQVAHAYLFWGPSHVGKQTTARIFAQTLLCTDPKLRPCGECAACRQFLNGAHPDVHVIERQEDAKGNLKAEISIDQIRDLVSSLNQRSLLNGYKIALIPEAERLTIGAANALLKLLEEPAPRTVLILGAPHPEAIVATLSSRCVPLNFLPVPVKTIEHYLETTASSAAARLWARHAIGRPGRGLTFIQSEEAQRDHEQHVSQLLSLIGRTEGERLQQSGAWGTETSEVIQLLNSWEIVMRDALLVRSELPTRITHSDRTAEITQFAQEVEPVNALARIAQARAELQHHVGGRAVIENILIHL